MKSTNQMPPEVLAVLDQFLRDMARLKVEVFGLAYILESEPSMAILRTNAVDPIEQAESMVRIIRSAVADKRIEDRPVPKLN